jgi:SAM-dependent methyltransferase
MEQDDSLDDVLNLAARVEALSQLDFVDQFVRWRVSAAERGVLGRRTAELRARLEEVDEQLFGEAWTRFRAAGDAVGRVSTPVGATVGDRRPTKRGDADVGRVSIPAAPGAVRDRPEHQDRPERQQLRAWLEQFTAYRPQHPRPVHTGYDALDALVDGAFNLNEIPAPTRPPEREMIHLEPTPVRVVLELADRVSWQPGDVFYDLGSGLGQVPILIHLLTGVRAVGVEIEPAYCRVARATAEALDLPDVSFVEADARAADYLQGTVFYLFTPFVGEMLQAVLDRLHDQTRGRVVTVCSYGPCCPHVARQPWLKSRDPDPEHEFKLALFEG